MRSTIIFTLAFACVSSGCDVVEDVGRFQKMADAAPALDGHPASSSETAQLSDGGGETSPPDTFPSIEQGSTTCQPNVAECVDLARYRKCNAAGTGYLAAQNCPKSKRCEKGVCVDAGKVVGRVAASMLIYQYQSKTYYWGDLYQPNPFDVGGVNARFDYDYKLLVTAPSPPPLETCTVQTCASGSALSSTMFDGGSVAVTGIPTGNRTLTFDATASMYKNTPSMAETDFPYGKTLSFSGMGKGLVQGTFAGTIQVPPKRLITLPVHDSVHTKTQPLKVTWSGATGKGQVRIFVTDLNPGIASPQCVTCTAADDGEFIVPATHYSAMSTGSEIGIMLDDWNSTTFSAPGLDEGAGYGHVCHKLSVFFQ